jgi:Protein of unknown function (DUF2510)
VTAEAGWYADPLDAAGLRYWDGSAWTEHTAPGSLPPPPSAAPVSINVYDSSVDLSQALDAEQRERYMHHTLKRFPTWLVVVLHILTFGLFTLIYQGLKLSKLPLIRDNDFGAGKGIGFMFIPIFNIYWMFRFVLSVSDRLNFQFRVRGYPPPISRELALASCILRLIPYINIVGFLFVEPIVAGQWQSATNKIVRHGPSAETPAQTN